LAHSSKAQGLGSVLGDNTGYLLHTDPHTKRQSVRLPDVSFVRAGRKPTDGFALFEGAPDLAVEIVSPNETLSVLNQELHDYFRYGTQQMWLVYPTARVVEVYAGRETVQRLAEAAILLSGELLPEFRYPLPDLFACLA
jgi:Uma2 family endonuclease